MFEILMPSELEEDMGSAAIYRLFTSMQQIASGRYITTTNPSVAHEALFSDILSNPRIQTFLDVVNRIDGKVVVWCKYAHEITDVCKVLRDEYGTDNVVELHGGISPKARKHSLLAFEQDARFLVANKHCGGYGLNLQYCSYAIYYNNDFCWGTRAQSEDRLHRMGQTSNVHLINILAYETIDVTVLDNLAKKTNLVDEFRRGIDKLKKNPEYLRSFFKGGDAIVEEIS
jgi:SNF2 family DNA or RNA helicase